MKKIAGLFFLVCFLFLFSPQFVHAESGEDILKNVGGHLQPESLQQQVEEPTTFLGWICKVINIPFICAGAQVQVLVPSEKTISEEEINSLDTALNLLEQDVAGTSSAQVLGITSNNLLSWFVSDEEKGVTAFQFPAQTDGNLAFNSSDPETAVQNLAQLYTFEKNFTAQADPILPPEQLPLPPEPGPGDPITSDPNQPTPGTPLIIGGGGGAAQATNLVNSIRGVCNYLGSVGRVTSSNLLCLDRINPPLRQTARIEFRNSALAFFNLQCVGFVRGAKHQLELREVNNGGNAIDFSWNIPTGYRLVRRGGGAPRAGDLMLWNTSVGENGHIAYVSRVYDARTVDIIEANWGLGDASRGKVQQRSTDPTSSSILGWLTPL